VCGRVTQLAPVLVGEPPLNLDVRRHDMYSQWQAAWRSAWAVGVVLLAYALFHFWPDISEAPARRGSILFAMSCGVGLLTLVIGCSFRYGLRLSGKTGARLLTIVVTPAAYLAILKVLTAIPIHTHAVRLDMPVPQPQLDESLLMNAPVLLGSLVLLFVLLPIAVSYCVARTLGGRANVV
jgi:hypothetical protein